MGIGVREAMRYGVARGLFSNEAGMGSTPHAHALAKVEKPQDQGIVAMICVFIDTFVVLTITALVMITSGALNVTDMSANPAAENMAQVAFSTVFRGFGDIFVAICLLFFAFSTIIGWYFFGRQNVKYLFGTKAVKVYSMIAVVCVALGSVLDAPLVWNLSDLFNALMVFPNLIALLALSGLVAKVSREDPRTAQIKKQKRPPHLRPVLFLWAGDRSSPKGTVKEGIPSHRRCNSVHGIEEGEALVCQVETAGIEPPAPKAASSFPGTGRCLPPPAG